MPLLEIPLPEIMAAPHRSDELTNCARPSYNYLRILTSTLTSALTLTRTLASYDYPWIPFFLALGMLFFATTIVTVLLGACIDMEIPFGDDPMDLPGLSYVLATAELTLTMIVPLTGAPIATDAHCPPAAPPCSPPDLRPSGRGTRWARVASDAHQPRVHTQMYLTSLVVRGAPSPLPSPSPSPSPSPTSPPASPPSSSPTSPPSPSSSPGPAEHAMETIAEPKLDSLPHTDWDPKQVKEPTVTYRYLRFLP